MSAAPSSAPLERGKACLRCRRRKMRCDGSRPACGQCERANRGADCEYADGQGATTSQLLEQQVTHLEGRIAELESATAAPLTLHDPYEAYRQSAQSNQQRSQDQHTLMRFFFQHASEVGFFLHIQRFLQTASALPHPDHISLLLNVIYLLGAQFSGNAQLQAQQGGFLSRALEQITPALSSGNPSAVIYVLQAEILLSYYFLDNNRSLEGTYHMKAAASVAFACKLHQIRSSRPSAVAVGSMQYRLLPPADGVEEGERINALWTTFILDKCWGVALGLSSAFTEDESKGTQIDVPWPLDLAGYENHPLPGNLRSLRTVQTFLQSPSPDGTEQSILALHAKASCLFAFANYVASRWDPGNASFQARFSQLDSRIEQFRQTLPSLSRIDPARLDLLKTLLIVHTLTYCATIHLHKPTEPQAVAYNGRSWSAATAAAGILQRIDTSAIQYVNPIMAILLTTVADVIVRGIVTARSQNALNSSNRAALMAPLNQILAAMDMWGLRSPLSGHQRTIVHQTLVGL